MRITGKNISIASALIIGLSTISISSIAAEQSSADLMQQIQTMQTQLNALQGQVDQQAVATKAAASAIERINIPAQVDSYKPGTVNMNTGESNPGVADSQNFLHRERNDSLSFGMPGGGGITLYGNFDVSVDDVTNGLNKLVQGPNANHPGATTVGNNGWLPAISTNSTNVGLRGFQPITGWHNTQFLWQLQTNMAISTVGGSAMSNSAQSNNVGGTLTTGTSYIGLGSKTDGAVKIGKTFAPYALSTNIFNPFQGMLGSMNVVMGNTGGDNRVEFGTLLEHAIWYESPNWNGLSFAALFSPGQNRASDSGAIPAGSSNCNGGNIPGSGGLIGAGGSNIAGLQGVPDACNDGGFSDAFSASLVYDDKSAWYVVGAYEWHNNVNRGSDLYGISGNVTLPSGVTIPPSDALYAADIGNESAAKVGVLYRFQSTGTTIGGIFEMMKRDIPAILDFQNERQRNGTWLLIQQNLPGANQVNLGWAHAANAVGDAAGQHNFDPTLTNSTADMYTVSGTHQVDKNLSFYGNYAMTVNNGNAHYDLGAGGHGVTTDCHDAGGPASSAIPASGGVNSSPQCWGGATLQGVSVGMKYRF